MAARMAPESPDGASQIAGSEAPGKQAWLPTGVAAGLLVAAGALGSAVLSSVGCCALPSACGVLATTEGSGVAQRKRVVRRNSAPEVCYPSSPNQNSLNEGSPPPKSATKFYAVTGRAKDKPDS